MTTLLLATIHSPWMKASIAPDRKSEEYSCKTLYSGKIIDQTLILLTTLLNLRTIKKFTKYDTRLKTKI